VLTITIVGYTVFTVLSGLFPNVYAFAAAQCLARIFLIAEWVISSVVAAEEFPADRRGMAIGVIGTFAALGTIVCAGVGPSLLATAYGWRSIFFVGVVPLVLLGFCRRNLQETRRFTEQVQAFERTGAPPGTTVLQHLALAPPRANAEAWHHLVLNLHLYAECSRLLEGIRGGRSADSTTSRSACR
jgi:MFS transporter, putative metabolite:H+ symporter